MIKKVAKSYRYNLVSPGIFAEFYFPKRVVYQSGIIDALEEGISKETVKIYLTGAASKLLKELTVYSAVLDPQRYAGGKTEKISVADAKRRIEIYKNYFGGWSTYDVHGAFFNRKRNELQDELVQIVRVIFRFESKRKAVKVRGMEGMMQSITSWLLANYRLAFPVLNENQRDRFIAEHSPLTDSELAYVQNYYMSIAAEVLKWFDDCVLFTFGYLARRFWERVAEEGKQEDEIWVTSFFNVGVNILRPGK